MKFHCIIRVNDISVEVPEDGDNFFCLRDSKGNGLMFRRSDIADLRYALKRTKPALTDAAIAAHRRRKEQE